MQHAEHRDRVLRASGPVLEQRAFERGIGQLVDAERAHERVRAQLVHERPPSQDETRLGSAEHLVAADAHDVHAGGDGRLHRGLPRRRRVEIARAKVLSDGHVARAARGHQCFQRWPLRESLDPEVRGVHPQDQGGRRSGGRRIVGHARAIRGANLAEQRARLRHHIGHTETAADLHEFTPGDEHLAAAPERREQQQHRRRVVVHDDSRLGSRQRREQSLRMDRSRSPRARRQVVLERRVAAGHIHHALQGRLRQRRAPEVGVHDHARWR